MAKREQLYIRTMIDTDLMNSLDSYAEKLNISRTSALCVILSTYFDQQKALAAMTEMTERLKTGQKAEDGRATKP